MPIADRAAQFSPFAALAGYEEAVEETARQTEKRRELDEDEKERLNRQLRRLIQQRDRVSLRILYFCPDHKKEGGEYRTAVGRVGKVDENRRVLILEKGTEIVLEDILSIEEAEEI